MEIKQIKQQKTLNELTTNEYDKRLFRDQLEADRFQFDTGVSQLKTEQNNIRSQVEQLSKQLGDMKTKQQKMLSEFEANEHDKRLL